MIMTSKAKAEATMMICRIMDGVGANVFGTWHVSKLTATTTAEGFPVLRMKVNGFLHKGWIRIVKNEDNLYRIDLLDGDTVKKSVDDVWPDMLGDFLDEMVEHGDMTEEVYNRTIGATLIESIINN